MYPNQTRPIGVTLIALAFLGIGVVGALVFPIITLTGGMNDLWRLSLLPVIGSSAHLKVISQALDIALYLLYVAYAVIGFGLWKLKNWARICVLCIAAIGLLVASIIGPVFKMPVLMAISVIGMAATELGWMGWYLLRPRVRNAFGAWKRYTPDGDWIQPPALSTRGRLAAGALFAGILLILFGIPLSAQINADMQNNDAYKLTMSTARASSCVSSALGLPLEPGWMISGDITESPTDGSADLSIPVKGPKGKGTLDVRANKLNGHWKIESLVLNHASNRSIIVPPKSNGDCR